jgi:hypothetical protein
LCDAGGWPLSYALNPYRVYAVVFVKFIDVCFGFAGWAAVGTTFSEYYSLGYNVMALVSGVVTILVISDIWIPVLFYFVVRMIQHHEALVSRLQEDEEDSDDSELDEFDIRNNEAAIKNGREMRYRNLNQGFMKPFKSKHSVGSSSSDGDLSSSSSGEDEKEDGYGRRKKKKAMKAQTGEDDYDNKASGGDFQLNINLDMALGGSDNEYDGDGDGDNDGEGCLVDEEAEGRGRERQDGGLTSPGVPGQTLAQSLVQSQSPLPRSPVSGLVSPHVMPAAHGWGKHNKVAAAASPSFSPGKGSWGQATTHASSMQQKQSQQQPPRRKLVSFGGDGIAGSDFDSQEPTATATAPSSSSSSALPTPLPPKSPFSQKLPPLALDTSLPPPSSASSPGTGMSRPPSVPKLHLSSLSSPPAAAATAVTPTKNNVRVELMQRLMCHVVGCICCRVGFTAFFSDMSEQVF